MKNTHGEVISSVKLQAEARNFTKSNTTLWIFFTFLKWCKWYQIAHSITLIALISLIIVRTVFRLTVFLSIQTCSQRRLITENELISLGDDPSKMVDGLEL